MKRGRDGDFVMHGGMRTLTRDFYAFNVDVRNAVLGLAGHTLHIEGGVGYIEGTLIDVDHDATTALRVKADACIRDILAMTCRELQRTGRI